MPRKAEPSFELKKIIWDVATTVGKDKPTDIQRQLDYELEKRREEGNFFEDTPDVRTISRIVQEIEKLLPEVVVSKLPSHVWILRDDHESLKKLASKSEQATQEPEDPLITKVRSKHLSEIRNLIKELRDHIEVTPTVDDIVFHAEQGELERGVISFQNNLIGGCLREHLPFPTLWQDYDKWAGQFRAYVQSSHRFAQEIRQKGESSLRVLKIKDEFERPILRLISDKQLGEEPTSMCFLVVPPQEDFWPVDASDNAQLIAHWACEYCRILEAKNPLRYIEAYKYLSNDLLDGEAATNVMILLSELESLSKRIVDRLSEILIRCDYLLYTCRLCLGQSKSSS